MTAALATLNPAAQVALASCEQRIERGLKTFIDVGQALAEIRDSRLYKGTHDSFEAYLEGRWGMSRAHAYRMITAAEVVSPIGDTGLPSPTNEGQARALASVPPPERAEVWREAVERTDGKPTAKVVSEIAAERIQTPEPVAVSPSPAAGSGPGRELVLATLPRTKAEAVGLTQLAEWLGMDREDSDAITSLRLLLEELNATGEVGGTQGARTYVWWAIGLGSTFPEPERHLRLAPDPGPPSALAITPEQRQQIAVDGERRQAIENAHKKADRLVREVSGLITEIEAGVAYGEPGLVTADMVAGLREQADRLERYLKEQS